jgi:CubicO group peptidase (beta-lactamase class C family)
MRRPLLVLTVGVSLLAGAPLHAQDLLYSLFGDYVESLRAQAGIPGLSAAIVGVNDIVWEGAFGQQDIQRSIATRTDTPFHLDGLTQMFTASLILRCVEEGRLSLDDRIGQFAAGSPDANATIRQMLTHTSGDKDALVFTYRPQRLDPLAFALGTCNGDSFREMLSSMFDRLAMIDSVPGPDSVDLVPPYEGVTAAAIERYTGVLERLATPYAVDKRGRASPSQYLATTLTPAGGLVSTVRDIAQFDLALKKGVLLRPDTLASAWRAPAGRDGQLLPHGMGWFVQTYNGRTIVWQFGIGENASSSLLVMVPSRGLTLIMLANSDGLVKPFALGAGDLTASPFGRVFLATFAR